MQTTDVHRTALLLWKIWRVENAGKRDTFPTGLREVNIGKTNVLRNVMRIIIDSGLLYTATALTTFVSFCKGSTFTYTITAVVSTEPSYASLI